LLTTPTPSLESSLDTVKVRSAFQEGSALPSTSPLTRPLLPVTRWSDHSRLVLAFCWVSAFVTRIQRSGRGAGRRSRAGRAKKARLLTFLCTFQHYHDAQLHLLHACGTNWTYHHLSEPFGGKTTCSSLTLVFLHPFAPIQMQYDVYKHVDTTDTVFNEIDEAFMQVSSGSRRAWRCQASSFGRHFESSY
jgi:hypothetical protein